MQELRPKEPLMAILLHFVFPGVGQIYGGAQRRGLLFVSIFVAVYIVYWFFAMSLLNIVHGVLFDPSVRIPLFSGLLSVLAALLLFAFNLFVVVDGYRCVKRWNLRHNLQRKMTGGKRVLFIIGMLFVVAIHPIERIFEIVTPGNLKEDLKEETTKLENDARKIKAFKVVSRSMEPTLLVGDRILVNKEAYKDALPQRGDIVIFHHPKKEGKSYLFRVVGLPGETVEIKSGSVFVNGVSLAGSPWSGIHYDTHEQQIQIPNDQYFVLGDNGQVAMDSRYFGFVPKQNLIGKAYKIYWPLGRSGHPLK